MISIDAFKMLARTASAYSPLAIAAPETIVTVALVAKKLASPMRIHSQSCRSTGTSVSRALVTIASIAAASVSRLATGLPMTLKEERSSRKRMSTVHQTSRSGMQRRTVRCNSGRTCHWTSDGGASEGATRTP